MRWGFGVLAICGMLWSGPAAADTEQVVFSVQLSGIPVGQMVVAKNANGSAYAAKGEFRTTGLVGLLARVRFTMSARGVGSELNLRSREYKEDLDTGYRTSAANLSFAAGDHRIDPLTGIIAALLARSAQTGCTYDGKTWDGKRAMSLRIRPVHEADNGDLTCAGQLRRVSGYKPEEMAQASEFPFTIRYERDGERLVAVRGDVDTIHGKVALLRR